MGSAESTLPPMEDTPNTSRHRAGSHENSTRTQREPVATGANHEIPGTGDDPWWWEIENDNLLLDSVPNVTTESSVEQGAAGGAVALSDDFNTLLKIGENVNMTLNNNRNLQKSENAEADTNAAIEKTDYSSIEYAKTMGSSAAASKTCDITSGTTATTSFTASTTTASTATDDELDASAVTRAQTLDEFKEELRLKRMARQTAVQDLRDEINALRKQLSEEQALTRRLRQREDIETNETFEDAHEFPAECAEDMTAKPVTVVVDEDDENVCSRSRHANIELANAQLSLQLANSENLSLRTELGVTQKQVGTLKEVVACCKQMLSMKEEQCTQLKTKLSEIEDSFGEREMKIMSDNLRQEYERQLGNIRQLRQLYEERQRIAAAEHENLQRLISIKKDELAAEQERTKNSEVRIQTLLKEVETANNELATLREECNEHKFEKKALKEEMGAVNTLFSQLLMGFNGKNNLDIDRLATMLEENRTLLNDMATKEANCSDGATLPKLLFELVEQAAVGSKATGNSSGSRSPTPDSDTETELELELVAEATQAMHVAADQVHVKRANNVNKDVATAAAGNHDKCVAHEVVAADAVVAVGEHEAMQDIEGATDHAAIVVATSLEDNVNNAISNNNDNISGNSNKKHHHRKTTANSKARASASLDSNLPTSSSSSFSAFKFHEPEVIGQVASTQEIIGNLPKVWKVLMELLSHHKIEQVQFEEHGASEDCYKSVETPNGPKAELSVSKTYIKLKDLILEKKSLVKETNRLKTLNCHLDYRLNEQEKRLSAVSLELTKTWHLVGKMQRQHRQLHTQEQILRYQLQQKRRLLTELKDELEYCRRKWAAARAKNDESQEQCNDLRREFAKRKLEDANNSAESGYSDSGPPSDEEGVRAAAAAAVVLPVEDLLDSVATKGGCERNLRARFEHSRKIKRMQSTSPGRAACAGQAGEIVELRWNSAPPTCGWGAMDDDEEEEEDEVEYDGPCGATQGAIPKRNSRSKQRLREAITAESATGNEAAEVQLNDVDKENNAAATPTGDRAVRIQRLEEQCKSLIQQVLETSDNRERLEVQLCRFQDEIAPVQYAIPLNELITKKRIERMTRASSAPVTGTLTPREEEYTRKRSERLGRLEEESRQLISRIKRTSDRGHYLRCSLERLHRTRAGNGATISREGSFESNTEEEQTSGEATPQEPAAVEELATNSPLTAHEEAYTTRRAERLKRLEAESKQLLTTLTRSTQRGSTLAVKLDALHEQHGDKAQENEHTPAVAASPTTEKRLENIERISSNRAERLRILEEEGKQLISRLSSTSERGTRMINRIAEREQSRAARQSDTALRALSSKEATPTPTATTDELEAASKEATPTPTPAVAADEHVDAESGAPLLPTLKNVACTSIVSEELAACVTVTTTPSLIAGGSQEQQGAVPKTKPLAQLSVATKAKSKPSASPTRGPQQQSNGGETLEEMVRRLQGLPYPETAAESVEEPNEENKSEEA